ncbi:MAG: hypothetical protein WD053_04080 [Gracilimonas sp.]
MSDFINVVGESPFYKGTKIRMWLASNLIGKVYPVYAEKGSDGEYWECKPSHKNAEVVSYLVADHNGNEYYCDAEELKKIGIKNQSSNTKIGFRRNEKGKIEKM